MRKILKASLILVLAYSFLLIGLYIAMCQKPHVFASIMSRTPVIVFLAFPFKPMWLSAREGELSIGDEAPDFSLETYDKGGLVRLSDFRGKKPVVLVFGSYT
jgi:hypothetical protein